MSGIIGISPNMKSGILGGYPTGTVIQTVSHHDDNQIASTTNPADHDLLSCTITPRFSSSKVAIFFMGWYGQGNHNGSFKLFRGSTALGEVSGGSYGTGFMCEDDSPNYSVHALQNLVYNHIDTPATTSDTVYKVQANSITTFYWNRSNANADVAGRSTLILQEIAG